MNTSGPLNYKDVDDLIYLGAQGFNAYRGLQFFFDNKTIGILPYSTRQDRIDPVTPPARGGLPVWAIVLIVIASLLVVGGIGFYFYKRSKLQSELQTTTAEYGRL